MSSDLKGMDVFTDPLWLLQNLLNKHKVIRVPTNGGWTTSVLFTGGVAQAPSRLYLNTGGTASSRGLASAFTFGLNAGTIARAYLDWTKRLELSFILCRQSSDVEVIARFQLKEASTEGLLAQRGIGVEISNYTMVGEAYGTARNTVPIATLTDDRVSQIRIVKLIDRVEFWVNRILAGTLTGTAVPNVTGAASAHHVASIINGATGGVDAGLFVGNIMVIQSH